MNNPSATYRIQFHKDFTFKHLDGIIPYLKSLGVQTIYASPIFEAIPGSTHGYDIVNPLQINHEIGTEEELIALSSKLKVNGINWLQDIVPNHMSFHPLNKWLMDVLEKWDQSTYFNFFDLNFPTKLNDNRLMVPFLGESLAEAVDKKLLKLIFKDGKLYLSYMDSDWPVNFETYQLILPPLTFKTLADFQLLFEKKSELNKLTKRIDEINNNDGELIKIAYAQYYRLCHWQETEIQINYRRFFTVNSLICLNIQHQEVFDTYHQYVLSLVEKGVFQGLRIDHVDGLFDPKTYLERLRNAVGEDIYIVVEKILGQDEEMPADWPIQGNTGYDFLAIVNNLFTNRDAEKSFNKLYKEVIHKPIKVAEQILIKKSEILYQHMQGELDNLHQLFIDLALADKNELAALQDGVLKKAIADFLIHCPIYRFYGNSFPLSQTEHEALANVFLQLDKTSDSLPAINLLTTAFLDHSKKSSSAYQKNASYFYQRCMQFSGPLMAKGVEDTLMYTYNRFIAHTEVGDAPDAFGLTVSDFHEKMQERLQYLPLSINATATHDTKRGEDVRARLNVLTDLPASWRKLVLELQEVGPSHIDADLNLHQNDIYLIYQTLLGAIPLIWDGQGDIAERLQLYLEKALREAKKRSDWASPNNDYEEKAKEFIIKLLDKSEASYTLLNKFLHQIADYSIVNSLSQVLLKFTCPGIPDVYQGTELWDLSLVDPDNRRPVDFKTRSKWLKSLGTKVDLDKLWVERYTGKIKLWLTQLLFRTRKTHQDIFDKGAYIPVKVKGTYKKHVLAYLRKDENNCILIAVPLGIAAIAEKQNVEVEKIDWKDTRIVLPDNLPLQWENLLNSSSSQQDILEEGLLVDQLFDTLPFALLKFSLKESERGAGILLHISSLPSDFGIGDLGPKAFEFVDFLAGTKQKYWQLLPLNPTAAPQYYSPYCAYAAMAGNTMLISPELLLEQHLLDPKALKKYRLSFEGEVKYKKAEEIKESLLQLAYSNYKSLNDPKLIKQYNFFCSTEKSWLNDFALFAALRKHHQYMPWNEWPEQYKLRDAKALKEFEVLYQPEIEELKWQQFIFYAQWHQLRTYANAKHIELIGDLPFYVAHDSADVWANTAYFSLDEQLNMKVVAGVPPDDFNIEGQLWGMPVFNWDVLKKTNYGWWINRLKKNMELFDILRLDHFRAFDSYWEVPATEEVATNGVWKKGPGASFFKAVIKEFHNLPFVAEDLGGDMEEPIKLRNAFNLAGMKVLQFGFGADLPFSQHIPHNYETNNFIVYTGTHDNNTTKGWYRKELDEAGHLRLDLYAGQTVSENEVHELLIRIAFASSAKIAIIPMQDILGLDETARMNTPATTAHNWLWCLKNEDLNEKVKAWLLQQTTLFGRA